MTQIDLVLTTPQNLPMCLSAASKCAIINARPFQKAIIILFYFQNL